MVTTIQASEKLVEVLRLRKLYEKESYEEVIWSLLEDVSEVNEETKKDITLSLQEMREGKTISIEQMKKKYGLR